MRWLICAGGTGGGVYPALAVLQAILQATDSSLNDVLWIGGLGGMEADLVKRSGIPFTAIPAAGVHGVGPRALPGNLWQVGRGLAAARQVLRKFRPQAMLFTGGYLAVPVALAARLPGLGFSRPKSVVYVPDIEPGLALQTITRFADQIAVTVDASKAYFPRHGNVTVTGYPTRPELADWQDKAAARRALGLQDGLKVLLVFGGSKGARSINRALLAALPELLPEMQVIHVSGELDWPEVEARRVELGQSLPPELANRYHAYPYLHREMGAALGAADLVLSRAGASCLGEFPLFGLPALLVPYPYAWRYQQLNARYLAENGAAQILNDEDLAARLAPELRRLVGDPERLDSMRRSMRLLARPDAAHSIAALLAEAGGVA